MSDSSSSNSKYIFFVIVGFLSVARWVFRCSKSMQSSQYQQAYHEQAQRQKEYEERLYQIEKRQQKIEEVRVSNQNHSIIRKKLHRERKKSALSQIIANSETDPLLLDKTQSWGKLRIPLEINIPNSNKVYVIFIDDPKFKATLYSDVFDRKGGFIPFVNGRLNHFKMHIAIGNRYSKTAQNPYGTNGFVSGNVKYYLNVSPIFGKASDAFLEELAAIDVHFSQLKSCVDIEKSLVQSAAVSKTTFFESIDTELY